MESNMLKDYAMEYVARILDNSTIPYCLVGESVLELYGLQHKLGLFTGFSIPAGWMEHAKHALQPLGNLECHGDCDARRGYKPIFKEDVPAIAPTWHFHMLPPLLARGEHGYCQRQPFLWGFVVNFYHHSDVLWFFPEPPRGNPTTAPRPALGDNVPPEGLGVLSDYYMLSDDLRLSAFRRHSPEHYPIKIPTPHRLLETTICQMCVHRQKRDDGLAEICAAIFHRVTLPRRINPQLQVVLQWRDLSDPFRGFVENHFKDPRDPTKSDDGWEERVLAFLYTKPEAHSLLSSK
ncbi:uncharacterized protein BO72DRAFT_493507 [Aspergillus fijiensis CBS 313.89]|uniref:Uncharacterized protein n=1 Tax=Aspergillus fijiensis CBS 313.89 TaxID=1448319 RepID=A0A8G1RU47_9EURO|nr:uncharacterized protein BO72DRAFT_493507 [Aspergillus fijiensis CBS 313.89]RAK80167.1 hypothetical protein BO72DRAFT_493507 [Aspergillus fijiensis CBS 313.89]